MSWSRRPHLGLLLRQATAPQAVPAGLTTTSAPPSLPPSRLPGPKPTGQAPLRSSRSSRTNMAAGQRRQLATSSSGVPRLDSHPKPSACSMRPSQGSLASLLCARQRISGRNGSRRPHHSSSSRGRSTSRLRPTFRRGSLPAGLGRPTHPVHPTSSTLQEPDRCRARLCRCPGLAMALCRSRSSLAIAPRECSSSRPGLCSAHQRVRQCQQQLRPAALPLLLLLLRLLYHSRLSGLSRLSSQGSQCT